MLIKPNRIVNRLLGMVTFILALQVANAQTQEEKDKATEAGKPQLATLAAETQPSKPGASESVEDNVDPEFAAAFKAKPYPNIKGEYSPEEASAWAVKFEKWMTGYNNYREVLTRAELRFVNNDNLLDLAKYYYENGIPNVEKELSDKNNIEK